MPDFRLLTRALLGILLILFTSLALPAPPATAAVTAEGTQGWCTVVVGGTFDCFSTPHAACVRQHDSFGATGAMRAETSFGEWYFRKCQWQPVIGDIGPTTVQFMCSDGYAKTLGGFCEKVGDNFQVRKRQCSASQAETPHPISLLGGAKRFFSNDFTSADGGLSLSRTFVSRSYGGIDANQTVELPSGLANWRFDFQYELQIPDYFAAYQNVTLLAPEGGGFGFHKNADGSLSPLDEQSNVQSDYRLSLVGTWVADPRTVKTYWRMTDADDGVWLLETFADAAGKFTIARPTSHTTRAGLARSFTYTTAGVLTAMTDSYGKTITFDWLVVDGVARAISQANLPGGYKLAYVYGADTSNPAPERLVSATLKNAAGVTQDQVSYDHDDSRFPTFVTGVRDRNAVLRWSATYDNRGRAMTSSGPGGSDAVTVAYGADGAIFTRSVTNALGKVETYNFSKDSATGYNVKLNGTTGVASSNCPASATAVTYGTDRLVASATDEEGRVSKFTWDARGLPTQTVEGFGTAVARTVTTAWHATFRVPTQVTGVKSTTSFTYDASGRPLTRTVTDNTTYTVPYATNGRARTWTYGWSTTGQLLSIDGPLAGAGDKQTWTYDASGYLATATDEVGHVTTITAWDWRGNPLTVIDANGVTTTLTYDAQGRVLTTTVNPGATQSLYQFTYDAVGNLTRLTLPKGGYLDYTRDSAGRVTLVTNDRGETITLTPNAMGEATSLVTRNAASTITQQQTFAYDELGRLIRAVGAAGVTQTTIVGYDKTGNATGLTDARGKASSTAFDALDRVVSQTDPESKTVETAYDAQDQLTAFKDGRALQTTRIVDGFGDVIREVSPDRGTRTYWYDAAGRATKLVDGDGEETVWTHDNAGRRLTAKPTGAAYENVTYSYDATAGGNKGVDRLTGVAEQSGSSAFVYDAQGRLTTDTRVINGASYAVGYSYDTNGRVTEVRYPSGRTVAYARANDGLVTDVSTKASPADPSLSVASSVSYAPFGPMTGLVYGNGLTLTRTYDQNYWLNRIEVKATGANRLDLTLTRNANGAPTAVTDNIASGRNVAYGYTDAGRLQYAIGAWGNESYTWDGAGNRTGKRRDDAGVISYEFAINSGANNRTTQVQNTAGTPIRNLGYRNGGDMYGQQFVGGSTFEYGYSARKRLVSVKKDGAVTATYGYDFQGRRVWRNLPGAAVVETHYVFDTAGHVLAEYNGWSGVLLKEYAWIDDMPVAMVDYTSGSAVSYFIHTGPTGEPQMMTDVAKTKVWDVAVDPFGKVSPLSTGTKDLAMRLPGQWLQAEMADLYQNQWRHYDPSLGRYIETDPLGLEAGQNVYAYVDGRPLEFVDPEGLGATGAAWGAGIGGAIGLGIGATAGGAGGTLVLPGVGTVGGAAWLGTLGLGAGVATGAIVGSYIEDVFFPARPKITLNLNCRPLARAQGNDFDHCLDEFESNINWCDRMGDARKINACHEWADDELNLCRKGIPGKPFRL